MNWISECIAMADIKLVVVYIMQEHVNPAKVVCGKVDLLAEKPQARILSQNLSEL